MPKLQNSMTETHQLELPANPTTMLDIDMWWEDLNQDNREYLHTITSAPIMHSLLTTMLADTLKEMHEIAYDDAHDLMRQYGPLYARKQFINDFIDMFQRLTELYRENLPSQENTE